MEHAANSESIINAEGYINEDAFDLRKQVLSMFNILMIAQQGILQLNKEKLVILVVVLPLLVATGLVPTSYIAEILNKVAKFNKIPLEDVVGSVNTAISAIEDITKVKIVIDKNKLN